MLSRLRALEGLSITPSATPSLVNSAVLVLAIVGAGAVALVARRVPEARLWVALLLLETSYLMIAPNFFSHYSAWIAPAAAVVLGTAGALVIDAVRAIPSRSACSRGSPGSASPPRWPSGSRAIRATILPVANLDADLVGARCVSADTPDLLLY